MPPVAQLCEAFESGYWAWFLRRWETQTLVFRTLFKR